MRPAVSVEREYIVPIQKKKKKDVVIRYKNPDKLSKKKSIASTLQEVLNQFYKEKYDMNDIKSRLGTDSSEYIQMLQNLTKLRTKIKTLGSLRTFLSKDFEFRLLNVIQPNYLTNDYLCLIASLCIENENVYKELTLDLSYLNLTSIGYYSNNILQIEDKDENEYFKKLLIEDANLDFSAPFPYLGFKLEDMIISNSFEFQEFRYMIITFKFKKIEKNSEEDNNAFAKGYQDFVIYYNENKKPVSCIYKLNSEKDLTEEEIYNNIVSIWSKMKIYTYDKSLGNYASKINLTKFKQGVYFVNTKCKPALSMSQFNYLPQPYTLNINMISEYKLPCSVYFNKCIQNESDPKKSPDILPEYLYSLDNVDAICQLSYVFSFYFGKHYICPPITNLTFKDLYDRIKYRNGIFRPLQNLWNKFVQITRIFIEANGIRINIEKYDILQKLTADWKSLYQRFIDNVINDKDMAKLYQEMNFPEYVFLSNRGEYINTAILKITRIILNKSSAIDFKYEDLESLLRGILIEIVDNFKLSSYDKESGKVKSKGFLPISASPFKILGNIIGKINHREDISDEMQASSLVTNYRNVLANFMTKNYNTYIAALSKDATDKEKLDEYKRNLNMLILDNMYKQYKAGLMDYSVIVDFGNENNISINDKGYVELPASDVKKTDAEKLSLLADLKKSEAVVSDLKAKLKMYEDKAKEKSKDKPESILSANLCYQSSNTSRNKNYIQIYKSKFQNSACLMAMQTKGYFNLNRTFKPGKYTYIGEYENPTFTIADFIFGLVCGVESIGEPPSVIDMIENKGVDFVKILVPYGTTNPIDYMKNGIYIQFAQLALAKNICKKVNIKEDYDNIMSSLTESEKPRLFYKFGSFIPIVLLYKAALSFEGSNLKNYVLYVFTKDDDFSDFVNSCLDLKFDFMKHIPTIEDFKNARLIGQSILSNAGSMLIGEFTRDEVINIIKDMNNKTIELKKKKKKKHIFKSSLGRHVTSSLPPITDVSDIEEKSDLNVSGMDISGFEGMKDIEKGMGESESFERDEETITTKA